MMLKKAGNVLNRGQLRRFGSTAQEFDIADAIDKHSLYSWGVKDVLQGRAVYAEKGDGVYFHDRDGKKYIDFSSQAVCSNLGHTVPESVIEAITKQLRTMPFMFGDTLVSDVRAKLSKRLAEYVPGNLNAFLFLSSGAEANEQAVRIAQRVTGRPKILSAHRSYHGGTACGLNMTGDPRRHWVPTIPGFVKFLDPNPYTFSWGDSEEEITHRSLASLHQQVLCEGPHSIAAIILESVVGTNGFIRYPKGYMEGIRELCDKYGIKMICDEVMTGWGRTGKKFGWMNYDVQPDIFTSAKGLTSAYLPLSVVGISDELHEGIRSIPLGGGSTYVAHPVPLACADAIMDIVDTPEFLQHVQDMEKVVNARMTQLENNFDCVKATRTAGLFGAVEFKGEDGEGYKGIPQKLDPAMMDFRGKLIQNGLFTYTVAAHIAITPPLIVKPDELHEGFDIIEKTLKEMKW